MIQPAAQLLDSGEMAPASLERGDSYNSKPNIVSSVGRTYGGGNQAAFRVKGAILWRHGVGLPAAP
jgi:hypothetical protein